MSWLATRYSQIIKLPRRFMADSRGGILIIFSAAILMLLTASVMGIEIARYSIAKNRMQLALDHSVLSAAAVMDNQDPDLVANNYFTANFPQSYMNTVLTSAGVGGAVEVELNADQRSITGYVQGDLKTVFANFVGVDEMQLRARAVALEDNTSNRVIAEIVLTLDNSASMCHNYALSGSPGFDPSCTKREALKRATSGFINDIYENGTDNGIYIGLVNYTHNVRVSGGTPPSLGSRIWPAPTFPGFLQAIDLSPSANNPSPLPSVIELTNSPAQLLNTIANITVGPLDWGFTRGNVGAQTAALMLMPYAEDKAYFNHQAGLPAPFDPSRTDKIVVLMTDGFNVTHFVYDLGADGKVQFNFDGSSVRTPIASNADNEHLRELCEVMKSYYRIIIYSVVYDLPDSQYKDIYRECASGGSTNKSNFFFDASTDADLELAYEIIAESIKRIRLYE